MGRKRRQVPLDDASRWVFNRMADVYDARPPYPEPLIAALCSLTTGKRVADLGAGIGHLALPLARRGFEVTAVDAAGAMLEVLRRDAERAGFAVSTLHAKAESLPVPASSFDLAVVSDALHFLDTELTAAEIFRTLAPRGTLAVVRCEFSETPFMLAVQQLVDQATPRRPRCTEQAIRQLATLARVTLTETARFEDYTPVDRDTLERILRSVSFVGPAMNPERFSVFQRHLHALPFEPVWARCFTLFSGRRWRT